MVENIHIVMKLYKALKREETHEFAAGILAPDLEWRFNGPPDRDYMMRVLTGKENEFRFKPRRVEDLGKWVVAEGWENLDDVYIYWVHAWAVEGGIITKLREYFNTRVTVQELSRSGPESESSAGRTVWESREQGGRQMPEIILPI